ncbi:hypothetical protein B0H13DRAFT_2361853 [Mycena leptocephala]|nr:hypothetical protein B0H13DRAFT_2361853 [Mycena leptocephala]
MASRNQKIGDIRALNDETLVAERSADPVSSVYENVNNEQFISWSLTVLASGQHGIHTPIYRAANFESSHLEASIAVLPETLFPEIPSTRVSSCVDQELQVTQVSSPGCSRGDEYGGAPEDIHASSAPSLADSVYPPELSETKESKWSGRPAGSPVLRKRPSVPRTLEAPLALSSEAPISLGLGIFGSTAPVGPLPRISKMPKPEKEKKEMSAPKYHLQRKIPSGPTTVPAQEQNAGT